MKIKRIKLILSITLVFFVFAIFYYIKSIYFQQSNDTLGIEKKGDFVNNIVPTKANDVTNETTSNVLFPHIEKDELLCIERVNEFTVSHEFLDCINSIILYTDDEKVIVRVKKIIAPWMMIDWRSALNYILSMKDHYRDYVMEWAIRLIAIDHITQGIAWVFEQNLSPVQQRDYLTALFLQLAEDDPEIAILELDSFYDLQLKNTVLASIIEFWGENNAREALSWLENQIDSDIFKSDEFSNNEFYRQLKRSIEWQFMKQNPMSAAEYIQNKELGDDKVILSSYYADYLANIDFYNALTWAKNLDEYHVYQAAIQAVLEVGSHSEDYQFEVLTLASEQSDPVFRDALLANVSVQISALNLEKMIDYLPNLPESAQAKVIDSIILSWLEKDQEQVIDWLQIVPEGDVEINAKKVIVQKILEKEPTRAFGIATSISNPEQRLMILKSSFAYLVTQNPQLARFELEQLEGISEEEREKLSQELDNIQ
ncbi:hypothetical protein ACM9HF_04800 [Colwellia sp. RE-S-Sl-9]